MENNFYVKMFDCDLKLTICDIISVSVIYIFLFHLNSTQVTSCFYWIVWVH